MSWVLVATLALGWFVYLRPPVFGGDTTYVFIKGTSMEPTYHTGDLVLVRRRGGYGPGDVAAFRVLTGSGEVVVIHRITEVLPDGTYRLQGDNRDSPDPWYPSRNEVMGVPLLMIPAVGAFALRLAASPVLLASVCGFLAACSVAFDGRWVVAACAGRFRRARQCAT